MSTPTTIKYLANGAIYDSIGNKDTQFISSYNTLTSCYYLLSANGSCTKTDFYTEKSVDINATKRGNTNVYSIIAVNDTVYGYAGYKVKQHTPTKVLYVTYDYVNVNTTGGAGNTTTVVFNKSHIVEEKIDFSEPAVTIITANSVIRDIIVDEKDNLLIVHNTRQLTKLDTNRNLVYKIDLNSTPLSSHNPEILAIDWVHEYTTIGKQSYPILLCRSLSAKQLMLTKINESTHLPISTVLLGIDDTYAPPWSEFHKEYCLTNYEYLKHAHTNKNALTFRFKLTNELNNKDVLFVNIPFDYTHFLNGSHHFALRFDAVQGNISLFVDGELHTNREIPAGKYIFQDILQDAIAVGTAYFYNNETLFHRLQQNNYFIDNCAIKDFKLYSKALTDTEIRFLYMQPIKIGDLIASLPSDQRNELEQIEQTFKFTVPGAKSNSINIRIKNSNIVDTAIQDKLIDIIKNRINSKLPLNTNIQNIIFDEY